MRQRAPRLEEQFHRAVKGRRIAPSLGDDGEELLHVVAEERRFQQRLARLHPVHIAAQRIDLAVVRDVAIRMRQRPAGKRVRRKALMNDAQCALEPRVGELAIEVGNLRRKQQALIHNRPRRERGNVEEMTVFHLFHHDLAFDALPRHIELALEMIFVPVVGTAEEYLLNIGLGGPRLASDRVAIAGRIPPAQYAQAFFAGHPLDDAFALQSLVFTHRQKDHAHRVGAGLGQGESQGLALSGKKFMGNLDQDARAIPSLRVATGGASVRQANQNLDAHLDHLVALFATHAGDKPHAAVVSLVARIV